MASVLPHSTDLPLSIPPKIELEPLENGDHLDQPTFHARYEAMPEGTRAELINGIVYMMSPIKRPHGRPHYLLSAWVSHFEAATPGVEGSNNITMILTNEDEVEPDLVLFRSQEAGGSAWYNDDEYLTGSPELIIEVANSSASYDLNSKKKIYLAAGVKEYLVAVVRSKTIRWFINDGQEFRDLSPDADGLFRSREFPGLWLDPAALWAEDTAQLLKTLAAGLASR